jgi:CheY-like chemotaxis protein
VVQTAWNTGIHTNRAVAAGAEEILHKPVDVTMLLSVLRKYLSAENRAMTEVSA